MSSPSTNVITITDNSASITSMTYVNNSANVTSGQSYVVPPSIQKSGNKFTITFAANRKNSSPVANAFNASSGGSAHEYAASGGGGTPNELNFFFTVQVNVTTSKGTGSTLLNIGQGHYGTTNNWWLGGAGLTSSKPNLTIPVANGAYNLTLPISGTHDSYTFSAGTIADAYPITNVFVLMLENHSFDNMLAMSGIPGITAATTSNSNSYNGQQYFVASGAPTSMPSDPRPRVHRRGGATRWPGRDLSARRSLSADQQLRLCG